jgi:hypothetical protein
MALVTGALRSICTVASLTPGMASTTAVMFSSMALGMAASAVVSAIFTTTRVPSMDTSFTSPNETMSRE